MSTGAVALGPPPTAVPSLPKWLAGVSGAIALWVVVYWQLEPLSHWITLQLGLERGTHLEEAVRFFA